MTLEEHRRELMRSAHLAIALVPALGAIADDSVADSPPDASAPEAEAPDYAIAQTYRP
jgi:hypothetical protein